MKLSKFFRRSKKSLTENKLGEKSSSKGHRYNASYTHDDFERTKYRAYNGRHGAYNPALERNTRMVPWLDLPAPVLERIFSFVCPHATDESYETCEQSAIEDACMLCDLRDLSSAGKVCKQWRQSAVKLMYHSIRIDSVHYCEREIDLSESRRRRSRFDRNGVPEDPAGMRLSLLSRTLRDDPTRLGVRVKYFKTPYMLRESRASDLARTIAVLPKLKYVDLPEGLYCDDPAYHTLKLEVQARCPDLRKMTYNHGSELSLQALDGRKVWQNLEVLELGRIQMDPSILRGVLSVLECLRALKVSDTMIIDDDFFHCNDMMPSVPALEELILTNTPRITSAGLREYLSRPDAQKSLKGLFLNNTGVLPSTLHEVLASGPKLKTVAITEQVDTSFPHGSQPVPPLTNWSLQTLRWEITAKNSASTYASITAGYYQYLSSSLFSGGLPALSALYVRDQRFPDMLLGLPPPSAAFTGNPARPSSSASEKMFNGGNLLNPNGGNLPPPRFSSNNPFAGAPGLGGPPGPGMLSLNQTLEVFTKGEEDLDWGSTRMDPFDAYGLPKRPGHGRSSSAINLRPSSGYGLDPPGSPWQAGGARSSVILQGNGAGGFLAVPGADMGGGKSQGHRRGSTASFSGADPADEWPRPTSSAGHRKGNRDIWR